MFSYQFYRHLAGSNALRKSKLFKKLTQVSDNELIKDPMMEALIEIRWERIQIGIIYMEFLPYILFLITTYIYTI